MNPFRKDIFGNSVLIKRIMYTAVGLFSFIGLNMRNRMRLQNSKVLASLPESNVLIISNHQTYYRDVIAILHAICSAKWGTFDNLKSPIYLLRPYTRVFYVAAEETMKESGFIPRLFTLAGAITVKRTWRAKGQEVDREVDTRDVEKIDLALQDGWVITFPQGTTKPYADGRKGTALLIKKNRPVVVPVVINGFRRAFNKKGLKLKKKGVDLDVRIKEPLVIDYDAPAEEILQQIMDAIEQSENYRFQHYRLRDSK
jgi:1-acyl-sn-glycerol-3-phosphate acyltransferase